MISVQIQGGLANMMFQIAFIESMGANYGYDVAYNGVRDNLTYLKTAYTRSPHADEYMDVFENVNWLKNQDRLHEIQFNKRVPFHYCNIEPEDNTNYIGYFQSEEYFYSREFVEWLFKPSLWVEGMLNRFNVHFCEKTCSIHVRRTDYITSQKYHPLADMDYYMRAIETIKPFNIDLFYVFSDDIPWCMDNFKGEKFRFVQDKDYVEMFLMSRCTHNIIANSSFSWFGAWLGDPTDRVVICPEKWLGPESREDYKDVVPQKWIKL